MIKYFTICIILALSVMTLQSWPSITTTWLYGYIQYKYIQSQPETEENKALDNCRNTGDCQQWDSISTINNYSKEF